jgi:hypothetical protein
MDHDGEKNEKAQCTTLYFVIATKRGLAKASVDPGCTSLLASEDSKVMDTDQDENVMDDFSSLTFREP